MLRVALTKENRLIIALRAVLSLDSRKAVVRATYLSDGRDSLTIGVSADTAAKPRSVVLRSFHYVLLEYGWMITCKSRTSPAKKAKFRAGSKGHHLNDQSGNQTTASEIFSHTNACKETGLDLSRSRLVLARHSLGCMIEDITSNAEEFT